MSILSKTSKSQVVDECINGFKARMNEAQRKALHSHFDGAVMHEVSLAIKKRDCGDLNFHNGFIAGLREAEKLFVGEALAK